MLTAMTKADRSAFEDARREADHVSKPQDNRLNWLGTAVGLLLAVAALVYLLS